MEETLSMTRLGITGELKLTLQQTNPCESMMCVGRVNVETSRSAEFACAGPPPACSKPRSLREVQGHRGLANLTARWSTT